MWFVSRRRHHDILRERDGLQDLLFRATSAVRKAEIERDQTKSVAHQANLQLEAALKKTNALDQEHNGLLQRISTLENERDALLAKLRAIGDLVSGSPKPNGL
jgi:chromosome segregation ATPase